MAQFFENDMNKAISISILLHLLLLVLFIFIKTPLVLPSPEFTEVSFSTTSSSPMREMVQETVDSQPVQPLQPMTPPSSPPESEPGETTVPREDTKTDPVSLPKLRNSFDDDEPMSQRDVGKITPESRDVKPDVNESVYNTKAETIPESLPDQDREIYVPPTPSSGSDVPSALSREGQRPGESSQNFTIEGEAAKRTILYKVIPQYPPGLQKEAVIKIRIFVLPTGEIGQMLPVLKGDPVLEEITLSTLREWRFNPIPPGQEQKTVQGTITFRYELR